MDRIKAIELIGKELIYWRELISRKEGSGEIDEQDIEAIETLLSTAKLIEEVVKEATLQIKGANAMQRDRSYPVSHGKYLAYKSILTLLTKED